MNAKIRFIIPATLAATLSACGGGGGGVSTEFRNHTCNGVILNGTSVNDCPSPSSSLASGNGFVGESPMKLQVRTYDSGSVSASAWFRGGVTGDNFRTDDPHTPEEGHIPDVGIHGRGPSGHIVPTSVTRTEGTATYDASLGGGIVARVAEFGEIDGNLVVSAVDIEDGSFVADFSTNSARLELEKPAKDYPAATISIDDIPLIQREYTYFTKNPNDDNDPTDFRHVTTISGFETEERETHGDGNIAFATEVHDLVVTGGSVSGSFFQNVDQTDEADLKIFDRTGLFLFGIEDAEHQ